MKRTQNPAKATVILREAATEHAAETALRVAVAIEPLLSAGGIVAVELPDQLTPYARSLGVRLASKRNHAEAAPPPVVTISSSERPI